MKKIVTAIITIIMFFIAIATNAQMAIGKQSVTNTSVSLEFADTENRGMILPYVTIRNDSAENGTIIYDATDHKVKYMKDNTATIPWADLSVDANGVADLSIQGEDKTEQMTAKTTIGVNGATDTVNGILVLTDTDKAMVLPRIASPHLNIINPSAGMIVYDITKRQLAVYNGTVWSFWKP